MNKSNLYDYLYENSESSYLIEILQYEINIRVYWYGNHYLNAWNVPLTNKKKLRRILENTYKKYRTKSFKSSKDLILSNSYFSVNKTLEKKGFNIVVPWWSLNRHGFYLKNKDFNSLFKEISETLENGGINDLVSVDFQNKLTSFINIANEVICNNDFKAALFANDLGFFERLFIDLFKKNKIPTFVFLHGLPGRYNSIDDNRADYLIVWGDKIKKNYVDSGIDKDKIIVGGHPSFNEIKFSDLRFELYDVLVICKANEGAPCISNDLRICDRGNALHYLELLKKVLLKKKVENVRLRIHPSENPQWYRGHIDTDFYTLDNRSLSKSLKGSSLVIGPTSTVFLDAIYLGVNYLVFEPLIEGNTFMNVPVVPPFNGDDPKVPVAKNSLELEVLIDEKTKVDPSVFNEYVDGNYDLSAIYKKIEL